MMLMRVLRGDDKKRLGQHARYVIDRYLAFLHALKQSALRFR